MIRTRNIVDKETKNVDSGDVQFARFAKRLKAFAFDFIPILAYILLLFGVTMAMILVAGYFRRPLRTQFDPLLGDLIAFLTLVLPVILYLTLLESSPAGATWGKRKIGIRVVAAQGETLIRGQAPAKISAGQALGPSDQGQALLRSLVKFLPWQIAHTSLFHWQGGRSRRQSQPRW